ncbi:carboxylesterase, partial [Microbacterium testaceum]
MDTSPLVTAPAGTFRGLLDRGVRSWRGIRFAVAPTGERRWRDPLAAPDAEGEVDATAFGPVCPQPANPAIPLGEGTVQDEDCLSLNVWAPGDDAAARPVMVWLHGGAYTFGSSRQPMYDATAMVDAGNVIVVTVNYRLGALGFLDLSGAVPEAGFEGNLALKDVLLALRWVQRNIAAFGGDPAQVTVFGESAGGGLVTTLLATPSARGLFSRAIAESSPVSSVYGRERATRVAEQFLDALGVDAADPAALRDAPVDAVVAA